MKRKASGDAVPLKQTMMAATKSKPGEPKIGNKGMWITNKPKKLKK